ncbi:MAG: hypothetical protein K0R12_1285 [Gammaproteobacteria bacterium]|jgi:putative membrane protein|nr:hypothetical protein [Gammaproteobacteria bacterium]
MLWLVAIHLIFMVTWFSGLFYLPRLYVYHAMSNDPISIARFKIMERKLFFGIATPGGIGTVLFGFLALYQNIEVYEHANWMHAKLILVLSLVVYHFYCGKLLFDFTYDRNRHSHVFYRWLNEYPVIVLVGAIIMVVVKPLF